MYGRHIARECPPAAPLASPESGKWFRSEALALARLNHPNIAAIYDYDRDGDQDFLVMELVSGPTLSDAIARRRDVSRNGALAGPWLSATCGAWAGSSPTGWMPHIDRAFSIATSSPAILASLPRGGSRHPTSAWA